MFNEYIEYLKNIIYYKIDNIDEYACCLSYLMNGSTTQTELTLIYSGIDFLTFDDFKKIESRKINLNKLLK